MEGQIKWNRREGVEGGNSIAWWSKAIPFALRKIFFFANCPFRHNESRGGFPLLVQRSMQRDIGLSLVSSSKWIGFKRVNIDLSLPRIRLGVTKRSPTSLCDGVIRHIETTRSQRFAGYCGVVRREIDEARADGKELQDGSWRHCSNWPHENSECYL